MKIEKLTPEQESQMIEFREEWRKHSLSTERVDKETTKRAIEEMYALIGKPAPIIIFTPSLYFAQFQMAYCKTLFKEMKEISLSNQNLIKANLGANLGDNLWANLRANLWDNLGANLRDNLRDNLWANLGYESTYFWGSMDAFWIAFYEYPEKFLGVKYPIEQSKKLKLWSDLAKSCSWFWCYENYCFVADRPEKISFNSNTRLHCEDGPAVKWIDGSEIYYWKGVEVKSHWIVAPESVTKEEIVKETNAEKRRCIREIIGTKRYAELLDIIEIDRDNVNNKDVVLYRTKQKDDLINKHIFYVKVICHSTEREYFLCIPESAAKNAWNAVAWGFGKTSTEYMPLIET